MLPKTNEDIITFQKRREPSYTYYMNVADEKIDGNTDGLEAVKQAIYKILNTERYQTLIYSWNYGIELKNLFGMPYYYVCSELPRRIREALMQDDRIRSVENFCLYKKQRDCIGGISSPYDIRRSTKQSGGEIVNV